MRKRLPGVRRPAVLMLALAVLTSGMAAPGYVASAAADSTNARGAARIVREADQQGPQATKEQPKTEESHAPTPGGRIAFASDRDNNFEIYVMDPDGGRLTRLTDNPAEDLQPAWSPDGERIAFVSNRDGNQEIYVMNSDGSGVTRLTSNAAADLDPAWSPDGTRIAFVSSRDGNDEIYVMNADGTNQTNITNNGGDDINPSWSPSSAQIAFATNRDGDKYEIYRMNADGSNLVRLTNNSFNDVNPAWPPMRITFQSDRDGDDEIYTMNANGSNVIRLTFNADNPATEINEGFDIEPARSSDGARLVWVSTRDGNLEIYAANADGSSPTRLTNHPNGDINPDVEPLVIPASTIQFSAASYTVGEGDGGATITITRTGDTTGVALVDFGTESGTASDRRDFTPLFVTVEFAPGETSRTVRVPIIDDAHREPDETFTVTLGRVTGGRLGAVSSAVVTILDNDNLPASASVLYALTTGNNLLTFNSTAPGTISSTVAVTGLQSGESLVGIDVRPATQQLYGVGSTGRLYVINPTSGAARQVATISTALSGTAFGTDFNPVPDRLRVVSDADQNLRINVDDGVAVVDGTLAYAAGDANAGANPNVVAAAYINSVAGATSTTLYGIDSARDILVTQNPPNNGTLNTVGSLGVNTSELAGFDIAAGSNTAFASLTAPSGTTSQLYTINLTTGAATLIGNIGGGATVRGLAAANQPANPIDRAEFFVRQQYLDFLNREPDAAGLAFWTDVLTETTSRCAPAPAANRARCLLVARAQVSTAFFLSIEFQETGYFVIRLYREAFGRLPTFREFLEDVGDIRRGVIIGQPGAMERLAQNRREFLDRFVLREEFQMRYAGVSNTAYVDALFTNAGVNPANEAETRNALIAGLSNGTQSRATALAVVANTRSVFNALYNEAFVLMAYFGYLRRDPDPGGLAFWIMILNQANLPGEDMRDPNVAFARIRRSNIVEAFIDSLEYRDRFAP